jgi:hypothetical protein
MKKKAMKNRYKSTGCTYFRAFGGIFALELAPSAASVHLWSSGSRSGARKRVKPHA